MYLLTKKQALTIAPLKQFSYLLKQKTSITKAFTVIIKDIENKELKKVITNVAEKINQGKSIENAFASYPDFFPDFLINLLKLGVKTGNISETLKQYTTYAENRLNFLKQIKAALFYPLILFSIFIISLFFLINFIFPQILNLFSENLSHLPAISRFTITVLTFLDNYFSIIIFTGVFITALTIKFLIHKKSLNRILLKIPIINNIIIKGEIVLWLSSIQTSLKSGDMFFDAFKYASSTMTNDHLKEFFIELAEAKQIGTQSNKWNETRLLPEFFKANIYNILENESFALELIEDMYTFYQNDITEKINIMLKAIEPLLIVIMGLIIGLVSISVLLPILDSTKIASI